MYIPPSSFSYQRSSGDKLPEDLQKVVKEAALEAKDHNRKLNREMNAKYLEELKKVMNVTILTPDQKAAFQAAVQPVYDQFSDEIGPELIKSVQKAVKDFQASK